VVYTEYYYVFASLIDKSNCLLSVSVLPNKDCATSGLLASSPMSSANFKLCIVFLEITVQFPCPKRLLLLPFIRLGKYKEEEYLREYATLQLANECIALVYLFVIMEEDVFDFGGPMTSDFIEKSPQQKEKF